MAVAKPSLPSFCFHGMAARRVGYVEGQGDLASRFITPIAQIMTLIFLVTTLATMSP